MAASKSLKIGKKGTRVADTTADDDEELSAEETTEETSAELNETPSADVTPDDVAKFKVEVESPKEQASNLASAGKQDPMAPVWFAVHRLIDSPPTVGHFKFIDHNILSLNPGDRLRIPFFVAIHLVDKNIGSIVSDS